MLPQEIIRRKRDGLKLSAQEIASFVTGVTDGAVSDGQVGAFAMAVFFNGMSRDEAVALTLAMRDSGDVLDWSDLPGPVTDKHSTGGVGDNVSLMLAPIVAACGAYVPMISGRGLGHTGGTLDKMDAIPGYVNETWVKIDRPGVYRGVCAELCGRDHGFMPIVVRAVEPAEFDKWIVEQGGSKVEMASAAPAVASDAAAVAAAPAAEAPAATTVAAAETKPAAEPAKELSKDELNAAGKKVYGVGKIGDIFAHQDMDEELPTTSNVDGITKTEQLLRSIDDGLIFVNLVETDMLWGHRNDPVNFHRCLQDFDRRLPDLLDALRPGDLFVLTSDHGCDPTTPSTDHSREHALLLAYVEGRNADGAVHEGEFADVGATVNAWLGGKAPSRGIPGTPIVER